MNPNPYRRELLIRGGTLGLATLSGCACPWPSAPMGEIPSLLPGTLSPPPHQPGSLALPIVIDAHCHVFNVEDVPASAFLKGPVAHQLQQFDAKLIKALADIISAIAYLLAPSARDELEMLKGLSDYASRHPPHAVRDLIDRARKEQQQKFIRAFSLAAQDPAFAAAYNKQYFMAFGKLPDDEHSLSENEIYRILNEPPPAQTRGVDADPRHLVIFAHTLTSPRYLNLASIQKAYSGGPGFPAIDVFCLSLVDFDYWLGCKESSTSQPDQTRLLEQIAIMSGGAILPFVSYNPQSDFEQQDASFERVVDAIIHRGFIGVKIYPPMGYMPYGNACQARPGDCPVLNNAKEIDHRLGRLYAWCVDNNVPVMSHTSHSFGKTDAHDDCAAPYGWQKALEKFDGLRVQAGHFGGDSQHAHQKAWAVEYVRLMALPKARNLYVDLSNLGDLFTPDSDVQQAIEPLFSTPVSADSTELAANRMVFGSDWYMTQLSGVSDTYVPNMNAYLERLERTPAPGIPDLRKRVFGMNAVRLYGLAPGPIGGNATNWDRLKRYYDKKKITTPAWMCKLGANCAEAKNP